MKGKNETYKDTLLRRILEDDPNLEFASFDEISLNDADIKRLTSGLTKNHYLHTLRLNGCNLKAEHVEMIAEAMKDNFTISTLTISSFQNDDAKVKADLHAIAIYTDRNKAKNSSQFSP